MRSVLFTATALALSISCNNRRTGDTGMADSGGAGGLSVHDTMPSAAADAAVPGAAMTPAAILSELNVANTMEVQLSNLAAKKASSPKVKQVAKKLADDHTKNRTETRALAEKLHVTLAPATAGKGSTAHSVVMPAELEGKSGPEFDRAFVQHEIEDHQSDIDKIQGQMIPAAQNPEVKAYLEKTATAMQGHLASLQAVQRQLGN